MQPITRRGSKTLTSALITALLVLAVVPATATAVVSEPLPADPPPAPPPIPAMPTADPTAPPPAELISDPIEKGASCGDWQLQSLYGDMWPAGSTWWEFQCRYEWPQCVGACSADWAPWHWIDHFYYDGTQAVFYGEMYLDDGYDSLYWGSGCAYWWDAPTGQWYLASCPEPPANEPPKVTIEAGCRALTCTFYADAYDPDGSIESYAWDLGDGSTATGYDPTHTYAAPGTYLVTLTVTDNAGATAVATTEVTVLPNVPPSADFSITCEALSCSVDGGASSDADGNVVSYSWDWGDGTTGTGTVAWHVYASPGTYSVALTVTDDAGATATASQQLTPLVLTARTYKVRGLSYADLAWTGAVGTTYDVFRDYQLLARLDGTTYTDVIGRTPVRRYVYHVCTTDGRICSDQVSVGS